MPIRLDKQLARRSNYAFERAVLAPTRRDASALAHCAPAARIMQQRAAAQRER